MIKIALNNDIMKKISSIDENRFSLSTIELPPMTKNRLRKNSKKKSSYASNKIEGNPLTEKQADELDGSLSYLNSNEKDLLVFLLKNRILEFTPIDVSKMIGVTNKTIINRCAKLINNGFLVPNIVTQRIRSYSLSEFAKRNGKKILSRIGKSV